VDKDFHGWFCRELTVDEDTVFLMPRDHCKSTYGIQIKVPQDVLKNPNQAILVASLTLGLSKNRLSVIKYHLSDPRLVTIFPDILCYEPELEAKRGNKKIKWTSEEIRVKRTVVRVDETTEIAGLGKNITGKHFDRIYLDDVINENNVTTEDQMEKVITWWRHLQPIASPHCVYRIYGTRYDTYDFYGQLKEMVEDGVLNFRIIERYIREDANGKPALDGEFIYSYYNEEILDRKRRTINNDFVFRCQYWNDPNPEEDRVFKPPFPTYRELPYPLKEYEKVLTVDPSFTISQRADFTGLCLALYHKVDPRVMIEIAIAVKLTVPDLFKRLWRLEEEYDGLDVIAVESGAWQQALKDMFDYITVHENKEPLPIRDLHLPNVKDAKHQRIVQLAGYVEKGLVITKDDSPEDDGEHIVGTNYTNNGFTKQMYYYSSNSRQKNDIIDAAAMQMFIHKWGLEPAAKPTIGKKRPRWKDFFTSGKEERSYTWY
jgi:hypothetical protein